jgi:hypothetical protein
MATIINLPKTSPSWTFTRVIESWLFVIVVPYFDIRLSRADQKLMTL